jgi:hypothetical protein
VRGIDDKCKKTNKRLKNGLNTGFSGNLPSAENVFLAVVTGKPCIFVRVTVRGNTSTAFWGGSRRAGLRRRKRRDLKWFDMFAGTCLLA